MKGILKLLYIAIFIVFYSCGSFQAKNKPSSSEKADINDEFFSDDKKGLSSEDKSGKPVVKSTAMNDVPKKGGEADVITDVARGYASWYGKELQDKPTASGDLFDMNKFTAAHRDFPMGSLVLVRNLENGKKKLVHINDRGPYVEGRIIDVSYAAARDLGFAEKGVARVEVELIESSEDNFLAKSEPENSEEKPDTREIADAGADDHEDIEKVSEKDGYVFTDGIRPQNYTLRTGAFKIIHNAERYKEELEDKYNMNAFLGQKGKWHFVWIGDFEDKDKARKLYKRLKTDGLDVLHPKKVP